MGISGIVMFLTKMFILLCMRFIDTYVFIIILFLIQVIRDIVVGENLTNVGILYDETFSKCF